MNDNVKDFWRRYNGMNNNEKELMNELEDQKKLHQPASVYSNASDGFGEWVNEFQKGLRRGVKDVETGARQPRVYGHGGLGTRINNIVYDEWVGKDHNIDMLHNPYANMSKETKELINAIHGLPDLITVERIHELEEQVKILKDLLGLTQAQLVHELTQRAVTPNQIRAIIGLDKIETPRTNITINDVLERAEVIWHDNIIHNVRVVVSYNSEQPLTPHERQIICDMWSKQQHCPMKCAFYTVDKKGNRILVDEFLK